MKATEKTEWERLQAARQTQYVARRYYIEWRPLSPSGHPYWSVVDAEADSRGLPRIYETYTTEIAARECADRCNEEYYG